MRVKITTTLDPILLGRAKQHAKQSRLEGANAVIELALAAYFATSTMPQVWQKTLSSGWTKRLIMDGNCIHYEHIKQVRILTRFSPEDYTMEALRERGWKIQLPF